MDAHKAVQVLLCMSVENKEDVDRICTTASENGGKIDPTILKQMDGMYGRSFEDPDGYASFAFFVFSPLRYVRRTSMRWKDDASRTPLVRGELM